MPGKRRPGFKETIPIDFQEKDWDKIAAPGPMNVNESNAQERYNGANGKFSTARTNNQ